MKVFESGPLVLSNQCNGSRTTIRLDVEESHNMPCACKFYINNRQHSIKLIFACCWRTRKEKKKIITRILIGNIFWGPLCHGSLSKGSFAGNCTALTAWCDVLFRDFVLKCDCSFPENFLSLAELKSDLPWTNLKLPSGATWPEIKKNWLFASSTLLRCVVSSPHMRIQVTCIFTCFHEIDALPHIFP